MSGHRYLITGVGGFVARHFLDGLEAGREDCEVLGVDVVVPPGLGQRHSFPAEFRVLDLADGGAVDDCLRRFRPTRIVHLASVSNVGVSWKTPVQSFANNTSIFLNLLDGVRRLELPARILSVGSSEEYGIVSPSDLPLVESHALDPGSPYGVARVAQEQLSRVFAEGYGTDVIMTRSFNHIGPGQKALFVVPSFVRQIAAAQSRGETFCTIRAGNTQVIRDFLDVRDVVQAYLGLFDKAPRGEVYNVCSGIGRSLGEVLATLSALAGVRVELQVDPDLLRPNELPELVGSPAKLQNALGWKPQFAFETSLNDMLSWHFAKAVGES